MYVELTQAELKQGHGPAAVPSWLKVSPGCAAIVGAPMGVPEIFVFHSTDLLIAGTSMPEVLTRLEEIQRSPTISAFAISQFLHRGIVPAPYTEWEDIWLVGIGARVVLNSRPTGIDIDFERVYPYVGSNSTGKSEPSTAMLLQLLTSAVDRQVADAGDEGFLMMSSGKDSVSVAVALAERGRDDISCATYRSDPTNTENDMAAEICRKLGLRHRTLDLPVDRDVVEERLVRFFEGSPRPCGDSAQIPYALAVGESGLRAGAVLDGSGSDFYMGIIPSRSVKLKHRLRIRNESVARSVEALVPIHSSVNYLTRSRVPTSFPCRSFRFRDTSRFYDDVVETRAWWRTVSDETDSLDDVDLEGAVVRVFYDQASVHLKAFVAASASGMEAGLPYCDPAVADYAFNLPRSDRYDVKTGVSKILVRRMLLETIGYDADAVGKHFFSFAGDRFLREHRGFVLAEISSCDLWSDDVAALAASWIDRLQRRPLLYHSLLMLFQLSGWYNHSRYVRQPSSEYGRLKR